MLEIKKLKVKDVMREVRAVKPSTTISKLISTFEKEDIDAVAVVKDGKFIGDVHKHDLLKLAVNPKDLSWDEVTGIFGRIVDMSYFARNVKDLMHKHEMTVKKDDTVEFIAGLMLKHDLDVIPVVEDGELVGMITELDILDQMYKVNKKGEKTRRKK